MLRAIALVSGLAVVLGSGAASASGPTVSQPGMMAYGSGPARNSIVQVAVPSNTATSPSSYTAAVRATETSTSLNGPVVVVNTLSNGEQARPAPSAAPAPGKPPAPAGQANSPGVRSASAGAVAADIPKVESANLALVPSRTGWETPAAATPTRGFEALN